MVDQEAVPPVSHVPLPVSAKPIRISLDLAPMLFDQLTQWRTRAARQLGCGESDKRGGASGTGAQAGD